MQIKKGRFTYYRFCECMCFAINSSLRNFIFYLNLIFNRSFPLLLQYLCDSEIYTRRKFVLIIYYSSSRTSKRRLRSRCKSKQGMIYDQN